MNDLIKRDDALNACALREDNPPTEMQLSLRNVISALPAIDPTNRIEQTESKLTKTMEALRDILKGDDMYPWRIAREVLAELEGTK